MKSVPVKGHPGIRKKENGKYLAAKSIKRKKYYKEHDTLRDAVNWKNQFHPLVSPEPKLRTFRASTTPVTFQNGKDPEIDFQEVWENYQKRFIKTLSDSTRDRKIKRANRFFKNLYNVKMCQMHPDVITQHLEDMSLIVDDDSRRCNFNKELADLGSVLNWYCEHVDFTFHNPIKKFHRKLGKLKEVEPKKRDMTMDQLQWFFNAFEEDDDGFMFQTLAILEFFLAGRIQEAAAVNDRTFNTKKSTISISEKIVWMNGKPTHQYGTKTGQQGVAIVEIPQWVSERLELLGKRRPKGCKYFFQRKGKALRYNLIWNRYHDALVKAGLAEEYAGTNSNILRHSMATLSREIGGIDACQAVLRHSTARMSEHYGKLDVNKKVTQVLIHAEELFKKSNMAQSEVGVTESYQVNA